MLFDQPCDLVARKISIKSLSSNVITVIVIFLFTCNLAFARGGGGHSSGRSGGSHSATSRSHSPKSHSTTSKSYGKSYSATIKHQRSVNASSASGIQRDNHGRIKRSSASKHDFMKQSGYQHGRPGYVVDHIVPLKRGGTDAPNNMQWQTKADGKAKDKWE